MLKEIFKDGNIGYLFIVDESLIDIEDYFILKNGIRSLEIFNERNESILGSIISVWINNSMQDTNIFDINTSYHKDLENGFIEYRF